jgi:hypothetical protein
MEKLERIMSRPVAKPYRSRNVKDTAPPYLNADGLLDFSPGDIESMCISHSSKMSSLIVSRSEELVERPTMVHHLCGSSSCRKRHLRIQQPFWLSSRSV